MRKYQVRLKENVKQLNEVLRLLFPQNKQEIYLFFGFVIFYFSYSFILALNTNIVDFQDYWYDVYFSFDNPIIYNQGNVYLEGHPLMKFIWYPFLVIGNLLGLAFGYKAKTVFLVLLCCHIISLSVVYVYRYLREITKLRGLILSLLTLMFGFFSTNLTLCFTLESFTLTMALLTFTVYYYARCIQQNKGVTLATNAFFAISLGGITLTNFVKGVVPMLFVKEEKKTIIRKIFIVGILFAVCIFFALIMEYSFDFFHQVKYRLTQNISLPSKGLYYEKVIDMLFASGMFFPEVIYDTVNNDFGKQMSAISMDYFRHWWQYLFTIAMFVILTIAVLKQWKKNKYVQMLLLMLCVDVVIHVFMRYGLRDAQIYGAHWIFAVPFLLGWLYHGLKSDKAKNNFTMVLCCLFVGLLVNNIYQLTQFVEIAVNYFPPHENIELTILPK